MSVTARRPPDPSVERVVAATCELVTIAAPTGGEQARGAEVAARFRAAGLRVRTDEVGNVLAWRATGEDASFPTAPAIVVSAHLDTVFAADVPLVPRREGERLLGPGIGDNTVAVAALVVLAEELAAGDYEDAHPVVFVATVGEEGLGDLRGAKHLLRTVPVRAYVSLEGHLLDELVVGGIGSVRLRASYRGPGGHSWGDRGTPSAAHVLLRAGAAAVAAVPAGRHVNIGVIGGGTTVNAIAAEAELLVDLRDADAQRLEQTTGLVTAALERTGPGVTATVERIGHRPAGQLSSRDPLVRAARAARADAGLRPATEEIGSTECNAAFPLGIPTVCVGLTRGGDMHRPSEWIEIPPLADGLALVRALLRRLAAG